MTNVTQVAAISAAQQAAVIEAHKAMGIFVRVAPDVFRELACRYDQPLLIHATFGLLSKKHRYLLPYGGIVFCCESSAALEIPQAEWVEAGKIWIPG